MPPATYNMGHLCAGQAYALTYDNILSRFKKAHVVIRQLNAHDLHLRRAHSLILSDGPQQICSWGRGSIATLCPTFFIYVVFPAVNSARSFQTTETKELLGFFPSLEREAESVDYTLRVARLQMNV